MSENNNLRDEFISILEEKYGLWNRSTSRFGSSSFGEISNALSISASQFTKLISGTATDGMYIRSIENIKRLIRRESLTLQLQEIQEEHKKLKVNYTQKQNKYLLFLIILVLASFCIGLFLSPFFGESIMPSSSNSSTPSHPLSDFFDNNSLDEFNSPYLDMSEIQEYCPCSAFEGDWSLGNNYKLPLPGSKNPGLYYTAKSADVRMKCSRNNNLEEGPGRVLLAYEHLINEIWIDTELTPLSEKYFDKKNKEFTSEFENLNFEDDHQFKRVAVITSFFIDRFEIYDSYILRKGEPCGRYASEVDTRLTEEFDIDIEYILKNVLSNLTTTACEKTENLYCDPNDLDEGDIISFDCIYTIKTENLGIGGGYPYKKSYKLEKQIYADNLTCECPISD